MPVRPGSMSSADQPHTRLTRLADSAITRITQHPESAGDEQAVLCIARPGSTDRGMALLGFDNPGDAADLLLQMAEALCEQAGRPFQVINVPLS